VHPLDTVLEAARKLQTQKDTVFLFAGAGARTKDVFDFKKKHHLENIIQIPWQPREKVAASFGSADLHCVVMGQEMSGLVHLSKIYSVLASGKPFVFVGPDQCHVRDLEEEGPLGIFVKHGAEEELAAAILEAKQLSAETKRRISETSLIKISRMSLSKNLQAFYEAALVEQEWSDEGTLVPLSH